MNIPKQLRVGYNNREDTFTGKLAYITYMRGSKIAKEKSWEGWRDKKLGIGEFTNEPTTGFFINKKVGDTKTTYYSYGRYAYCRVLDPRGFEFEIKIENLIMILETESCIKKELTGSYVYGWNGEELWLLPTSSKIYKDQVKDDEKIANSSRIYAKNLVPGEVYVTKKDNHRYVYLGKLDFVSIEQSEMTTKGRYNYRGKFMKYPYFTFYDLNKGNEYGYGFHGFKSISGLFKYKDDEVVDITKYMKLYNKSYNFDISDITIDKTCDKKVTPLNHKHSDRYQENDFLYDRGSEVDIYSTRVIEVCNGYTKSELEEKLRGFLRPSESAKLRGYLNNFDKLKTSKTIVQLERTYKLTGDGYESLDQMTNWKEYADQYKGYNYNRVDSIYPTVDINDEKIKSMYHTKNSGFDPTLLIKGNRVSYYEYQGSENQVTRR